MTRIVVRPKGTLVKKYEIKQDFLRNARLIRETEEPAFVETMAIPAGAARLRLTTRRANLTVEFLR